MRKIYMILSTLLIVMIACNKNKAVPSVQSNGNLVIVDSSDIKTNLLLYKNNHPDGYYPIYFIGKLNDTIRLGEQIARYDVSLKKYGRLEDFTSPDSTKMRIVVDTAFSLSHTEYYGHFDQKQESWVAESAKSFKATPIFVYNLSNLNIAVGWSNNFGYMVRQVKNKKGKWIDIELPLDYHNYCLSGARFLVIEPKQMIVAKLLRHEGNVQAVCRLKFSNFNGTVYSNTFTDAINEEQLIKKTKSIQ